MFTKTSKTALLCATLVCTALPASADVYKWVDGDGSIHYSDRKPQNTESRLIKTTKASPSPNANETGSLSQQIDALDEKEEIKKLQTQQEDYCKSLKSNIETLTNNARVRIKGDDGELRYLTAEEIVKKRKSSQQSFSDKCKNY
jgi:hypothetical protein